MHTLFDPKHIDWEALLLSKTNGPLHMYGGGGGGGVGFPVFHGIQYQRGAGIGSVFRTLLRYLMPIGKEAIGAIGRQGLESGVRVLSDALDGRSVKESALAHGREGAKRLLQKASSRLEDEQLQQKGHGFRRKSIMQTLLYVHL